MTVMCWCLFQNNRGLAESLLRQGADLGIKPTAFFVLYCGLISEKNQPLVKPSKTTSFQTVTSILETVETTGVVTDTQIEQLYEIDLGELGGDPRYLPLLERADVAFARIPPVNLLKTAEGYVRSTAIPSLDPGSGYVLIIESRPLSPVQIAWIPGHGATQGGAPVPTATQRKHPHSQYRDAFPSQKTWWSLESGRRAIAQEYLTGAYVSFNADGSLSMTTKSGQLNAEARRLGRFEFRNAGILDELGPTTYYLASPGVVLEMARLVANASARTVVIADDVEQFRSIRGHVVRPAVLSTPVLTQR